MKFLIFVSLFIFSLNAFSEECNDSSAIYKICSNQVDIYDDSVDEAIKSNKLVLVKFGADWCPWCHSLHALFKSKEYIKVLGSELQLSEVGLYNGSDFHPTGSEVFHKIINEAKQEAPDFKGVPFLVVINPVTKKAIFMNTAELELNTEKTKGHDSNKVFDVLKKSIKSLK